MNASPFLEQSSSLATTICRKRCLLQVSEGKDFTEELQRMAHIINSKMSQYKRLEGEYLETPEIRDFTKRQ